MKIIFKLLKVIWFLVPLSILDFILQSFEIAGEVAVWQPVSMMEWMNNAVQR